MKCIIFVNRIVTARALSFILRQLELLRHWKSDFLVGVHSGVKIMSRKAINMIVEKFRSGEVIERVIIGFHSLTLKYVIVRTE
jgi:endoribonuclease Dicer